VRQLAWVVTAEGLISSELLPHPPESSPPALPTCLPWRGLTAVDATTGQQLLGIGAGPVDVCLGIADAYLDPPSCPKKI
jgi:hypothetical protein